MFRDGTYPISMIYLYCMMAMCQMNLKHQQKAKDALMLAWNMAKEDEFLEPFIEHHGLLQGYLCRARHNEPYDEIDVMPRYVQYS